MSQDQLAGILFILSAVGFTLWWQLRIDAEYKEKNRTDDEDEG
jgi:hypothetical protein